VVVVGSSDLTHHGGHFGSPGGHGPQSEAYARNNDQRMIQRIETLDAKGVLVEANEHRNACGGGAIAATIAAVRGLGATSARLLEYTNSYQVIRQLQPSAADDTTVGYAAMVFI
jgi:AmmeMemoRadiSam system protein B